MSGGPARVLDSLRRAGGSSRSGEALSEALGVTRSQIWKHVESLRSRGYAIDAEAGDGYRLTGVPDRLYAEEVQDGLGTAWLAQEYHHHDSVDSTNRVALELARAGATHGATVVAEGQTAGRGRLGRDFFSPPYRNLYTSIVLRPDLDTAQAPTWILGAATAVAESVAQTLDAEDDVEIKWPNDVLLGGLKTSGILMELAAEATRVSFLVLGIGVNLNVAREDFPESFRSSATSLASHCGSPIDRIAFAQRLFRILEETLDTCAAKGFEGVRPRFEARFRMRGRGIRVRELDGTDHTGTVRGIDADGALRIVSGSGDERRIVAGDVTLAREVA